MNTVKSLFLSLVFLSLNCAEPAVSSNSKGINFKELELLEAGGNLGEVNWLTNDKLICSDFDENENKIIFKTYDLNNSKFLTKSEYLKGYNSNLNVFPSPDGTKFALNKFGLHKILIYDLDIYELKGCENSGVVTAITWSNCSNNIAVGFSTGTIIIYNIQTRDQIYKFKSECTISALAISPDNSKLIYSIGDSFNSVFIKDLDSNATNFLYNHNVSQEYTELRIEKFIWLNNQDVIGISNNLIIFGDISENFSTKSFNLKKGDKEYKIFISPNGKLLAILKAIHNYCNIYHKFHIYDIENSKFVAQDLTVCIKKSGREDDIMNLAWSPDSEKLAAASRCGFIKIWERCD